MVYFDRIVVNTSNLSDEELRLAVLEDAARFCSTEYVCPVYDGDDNCYECAPMIWDTYEKYREYVKEHLNAGLMGIHSYANIDRILRRSQSCEECPYIQPTDITSCAGEEGNGSCIDFPSVCEHLEDGERHCRSCADRGVKCV